MTGTTAPIPPTVYTVVEAGYAHELVRAVNEKMRAGWVPVGGVAVQGEVGSSQNKFYQAMAREPARTLPRPAPAIPRPA